VFFYLYFFANFDHTTSVNLVSDFTCYLFFQYFLNGHGFACSILHSSGTLCSQILGDNKTAILMHFGVKNSKKKHQNGLT